MKYSKLSDIFSDPSILEKSKYGYVPGELMHIEVVGHRSKSFKDLVSRAVEYYCSLMMSKRMCNSLEVYVVFKNKLEGDFVGFCNYLDHYEGVRQFEIEVCKNYSVREILKAIAHETVHLKQFATGELKDIMHPGNISVWRGEKINEDKVDYWDLPFEIEAYGREPGLYQRFLAKEGLLKNKKFLNSKVK